ncbi:ABC protein [Pisolithus orientalis]|uniref:ABC protein n=1 Tax=Pisolithus orientalis TaxID=936130 RepID=UPI0022252A96|nr:ABC protein [Pisolithus orientalis]KAI5990317.1 ABC protein [Pisolithus orientalis]
MPDSPCIPSQTATLENEEGLPTDTSVVAQSLGPQLDTGNQYVKYRQKFWQLWLPRDPPPPPPFFFEDAQLTPLANASICSRLTYSWMTELMVLGYQRTLLASDLYELDFSRQAGPLAEKLEAAWKMRVKAAADWNAELDRGEIRPSVVKRVLWAFRAIPLQSGPQKHTYSERYAELEQSWREVGGKKAPSLAWALNDVFGWYFWPSGVFKVVGDVARLLGPLVLKAIISFAEQRSTARSAGEPLPNVGRGIGMAIGLWVLTIVTSVCTNQFFWHSMETGILARAALIACIYKRGVKLTGKERVKLTNAALINHISTDVSRVDACAQWFVTWTAPIQVTICLIILLVELGPSALAGFSLFVLIIPLQQWLMRLQRRIRLRSMVWTERRTKVLLEVLGAMRVIKYFSYEVPYLHKLFSLRKKELNEICRIQILTSASFALGTSLPVLGTTLAFVTYTLTSRNFNTAIIFSSLSLFQLLRQPMMYMPRALAAIPDAASALERLSDIFHAELIADEPLVIHKSQKEAVLVRNATFEWESSEKNDRSVPDIASGERRDGARGGSGCHRSRRGKAGEGKDKLRKDVPVFKVQGVNLAIPRGCLTAIVGPVGSGKSSLLQGIIGEVRKVCGDVSVGGRVAYCSQTAWIQNATLRENVLFGQPFNEERYWHVIELSCLLPDLALLPDGDLTEIGERGINLSGGQKQRVNIARALYFKSEIVIFDDPLSAVDAHVGKSLFEDAILCSLRGRGVTVLLVTHALHFLPQVDYIYTMKDGVIVERGTFDELLERNGEFARLAQEYGGHTERVGEAVEEDDVSDNLALQNKDVTIEDVKLKSTKTRERVEGKGKVEGRLIVKERRNTGSVSLKVHWAYLVAGRGAIMLPLIIMLMIVMQVSQIMGSYTLVWWESNTWNRPNSFYQILYGCFGIGQALFTFFVGASVDLMSYFVSQNLHYQSMRTVFHAPVSFFDTTPVGRILGVFGKDVDSEWFLVLAKTMFFIILTMSLVLGSVVVVSILEPYYLAAVVILYLGYSYLVGFYRASAREVKRLDSMLRSLLYGHFSETFTGLSTIRGYGEMKRFVKANRYYIDLENRSLYPVIANQRWLAVRLEFMSATLTFLVALLAVTDVSGINAAQIGLTLTYTMILSQMLSFVTRQTADVENNMNSVERILQYTREETVPQEAPHEKPEVKPPADWPHEGAIEYKDVQMSYRPGLPNALHGISLSIQGGEKIGIVGRTGAGKSSLMLVLYRIVELSGGSIILDGIDISTLGLKDLRTKISIIPQDHLLFSGTIRSNLDPFNQYDDAKLWDALYRSCLVDRPSLKAEEETRANRYTLETVIESEGANLSVGERSLLSLARALVKDCKVVVLDEATASVDLETNNKIQRTIATEFRDRTLLCIAHRLRTIISYDRVLVMDAGMVAEFDIPYNLYQKEGGLFRGMCEGSNITLKDIEASRYGMMADEYSQ